MQDPAIEQRWNYMLNHPDEHVRAVAARASREPLLRALFPYTSIETLFRFSKVTEYPYDRLPFVRVNRYERRFEVCDWDNRPLAVGDLHEVMPVLVRAVSERLASMP